MVKTVEGVRQVVHVRGNHQRAVFIRRLLHQGRETRDLFDQLNLVVIERVRKTGLGQRPFGNVAFSARAFFRMELART